MYELRTISWTYNVAKYNMIPRNRNQYNILPTGAILRTEPSHELCPILKRNKKFVRDSHPIR